MHKVVHNVVSSRHLYKNVLLFSRLRPSVVKYVTLDINGFILGRCYDIINEKRVCVNNVMHDCIRQTMSLGDLLLWDGTDDA